MNDSRVREIIFQYFNLIIIVVMESSTNRQIDHPCTHTSTMSIHNRSISIPAYSRPANPNLILKHEILSGECDVFRASLPRRVYATRLGRLTALVIVVAVLIQITGNISTPLSAGTMAILVVTVIAVLSRTIEGN